MLVERRPNMYSRLQLLTCTFKQTMQAPCPSGYTSLNMGREMPVGLDILSQPSVLYGFAIR